LQPGFFVGEVLVGVCACSVGDYEEFGVGVGGAEGLKFVLKNVNSGIGYGYRMWKYI
jgi:hypothetical protein